MCSASPYSLLAALWGCLIKQNCRCSTRCLPRYLGLKKKERQQHWGCLAFPEARPCWSGCCWRKHNSRNSWGWHHRDALQPRHMTSKSESLGEPTSLKYSGTFRTGAGNISYSCHQQRLGDGTLGQARWLLLAPAQPAPWHACQHSSCCLSSRGRRSRCSTASWNPSKLSPPEHTVGCSKIKALGFHLQAVLWNSLVTSTPFPSQLHFLVFVPEAGAFEDKGRIAWSLGLYFKWQS